MRNKFARIASTFEYRSMRTTAQKAEYLYCVHSFKKWQIKQLTGTTDRTWRDMIKAHREGRTPGVSGRPSILTPKTERMLVDELILKAREGDPVPPVEIHKMVFICFYLSRTYLYIGCRF